MRIGLKNETKICILQIQDIFRQNEFVWLLGTEKIFLFSVK